MIVEAIAKAIEECGKSRYQIYRETGIDQAILCRIVNEHRCSMRHANTLCAYFSLELRPARRTRSK
jgi:hypothetical protein